MSQQISKGKYIVTELIHHIPFSIFGVMLALLMMGVLSFIVEVANADHLMAFASEDLYHVFHPSHILLSAVATTAMFVKHDGNMAKAAGIGFCTSIVLCSLSDIFFPYIGGILLSADMEFHLDIIDEPGIVLPFAIVGTIAGLAAPKSFEKATEYSHSMHVFVSSVASILYLVAFGLEHWVHAIGGVFMVTIFAVMLPCCLSDIVLPLTCSHANCRHGNIMEEGHHH